VTPKTSFRKTERFELVTPNTGLKPSGELVIQWFRTCATVAWDSGLRSTEQGYFLLAEFLERGQWAEQLISRLEKAYYQHWEMGRLRPRVNLHRQKLERVGLAETQWILETLPQIYATATAEVDAVQSKRRKPQIIAPAKVPEAKSVRTPKVKTLDWAGSD
jgi:hypothetical protein